ncbi:MAG: hypothetical protein SP1CHLAM54_07130 [Chlamydiia bacterium]|nr:hypothetical protein [Chlamydiia bacterium]MCH9615619.1 hypothetical protein [Chlamydiia bacterium]MCH9628978.1 hypothetical protein [Chlamydiia bacterium]
MLKAPTATALSDAVFALDQQEPPPPDLVARVMELSLRLKSLAGLSVKDEATRRMALLQIEIIAGSTTLGDVAGPPPRSSSFGAASSTTKLLPFALCQGTGNQRTLGGGDGPKNACTAIAAHFLNGLLLNPEAEVKEEAIDGWVNTGNTFFRDQGLDAQTDYEELAPFLALPLQQVKTGTFPRPPEDAPVREILSTLLGPGVGLLLYVAGETYAAIETVSGRFILFDSHGRQDKLGLPSTCAFTVECGSREVFLGVLLQMASHLRGSRLNQIGYTVLAARTGK